MCIVIVVFTILWLLCGLVAHLKVEKKYGKYPEAMLLGIFMGPLTFLTLRDYY